MKNILFIFSVCSFLLTEAQQPFSLATSSEIELQNKSYAINILPYGLNEVCMVSSKNAGMGGFKSPRVNGTIFNIYKGAKYEKSIELSNEDKNAAYVESFNNGGKLVYIDGVYEKSKKEIEIYYREIDSKGSVVKSTLMNRAPAPVGLLNDPDYLFRTVQSPNYKKILNVALYKNKDKNTDYVYCYNGGTFVVYKPNSMNVSVVNEEGKLLFNKGIVINAPEECDKISIEDSKVNDNGDVFLMVKQYIKGKKEKSGGEVNYKLYIYAVMNNGTTSKKFEINTKDYFCKNPSLVVSNVGNVYCAGFLSEKVSGNLVGIFTKKLTSDLEDKDFVINNITSDAIQKYNSAFKYKSDEISENFIIDYIIESENYIHISAEYYNVVTRTSSNGSTSTMYYYNDILYFKMSHSLDLEQIDVIPKYQRASSPMYLGYKLIMHNDNPYFIFNDSKKNADKGEDEKLKATGGYKNYAAMIVYKDNGKWVRERLFKKEEVDENILMTKSIGQLENEKVFLPFERGGKYTLGILTFK